MKIFCDISANNSKATREKAILENDGVVIKATEGKSYKNWTMNECVKFAEKHGKMIGFYHYARPENNANPFDEVMNFISAVYPYIGSYPMFLDWEGKATRCSQKWARNFLDLFYQITGVKMCLYCSESVCKIVGPFVVDGDYGLWVAKYGMRSPVISPWKVKLMWQFTSNPYDKSYMYGDEKTWKAYGKRG